MKLSKSIKKAAVACLVIAATFGIAIGRFAAKDDVPADIQQIMNEMTLYEKVCQMMTVYQYRIPDPTGSSTYISATETGSKLQKALEKYPVGGILYDAGSMKSKAQLKSLLDTAQSYSKYPLLFSVDEEGGRVARIGNTLGYNDGGVLSAMQTYQSQGPSVAKSNAKRLADNLSYYGFNWDYAPVADVNSNPKNTVIGTRAYADNFDDAEELIPAAVEGFHAGGVACTLKHFPGHGDTSSDTHAGSVYVHKSLKEIRENELRSFQAGIDAGVDSVMIAHIIVDEVGTPSLFSEELLQGILRDEMGFDGVIVTDGLGMKAMTDVYSTKEIVINGTKAGIDVFLCPSNLNEAITSLVDAVERGEISEQRIDESVEKILTLKKKVGLI